MRYAHYLRTGIGTIAVLLAMGTFTGCARSTKSTTAETASATSSNSTAKHSAAFTQADVAIGKGHVAQAIKILASSPAAKQTNSETKHLLTGLQHYSKATKQLNNNDLTGAGTQVSFLSNHPVASSAHFTKAVANFTSQFHSVKKADELYATAQDDMSTHDLNAAKTTINQLDALKPVHPVITNLQKRAVAFKEAIMNYEASQSTSSGAQSSEVQESSSDTSQSKTAQSSAAVSSANSTSSSTDDSQSSNSQTSQSSDSDSSSTGKSDESTDSSDSSTDTSAVLDNFKQQSGVNFKTDDQITVVKSGDHYQIDVRRNNATGDVANLSDSYRFWPKSGQVKKQNSQTGNYQNK